MKKLLKITGILILLVVLFRGSIYRFFVSYESIKTRKTIKIINPNFIDKIELEINSKIVNEKNIIQITNEIVSETLQFSTKKVSNNPNELYDSKKANCVGYSAMFDSIIHYLIEKYELENEIRAKHQIGKLSFLGVNVHQFFEDSFFKNHDFNEVINLKNGEIIAIDPSLSDCFWIRSVTKTKE